MNGVMRASVSAGSSQRETRVTCTPMARVPSGGAENAGGVPAQIRPNNRTTATNRAGTRIRCLRGRSFRNVVSVFEKLPHPGRSDAQRNVLEGVAPEEGLDAAGEGW